MIEGNASCSSGSALQATGILFHLDRHRFWFMEIAQSRLSGSCITSYAMASFPSVRPVSGEIPKDNVKFNSALSCRILSLVPRSSSSPGNIHTIVYSPCFSPPISQSNNGFNSVSSCPGGGRNGLLGENSCRV